MKRDLDLIRLILKKAEECEDPWGLQEMPEITGYSRGQIAYHTKLLHEAGLLEAHDASSLGPDGFEWVPGTLTWDGHEFMDASKDNALWEKAKEYVINPVGAFTFDLLFQWLKAQGKERLGLP